MSEEQGALFGVPELAPVDPRRGGAAEAGLRRAIDGADHLIDEDAGLIGAALIAARALDAADRMPDAKRGYLIAQLMRPYQDALAGLRLPAAVEPAGGPRGVPQPGAPVDVASLLGDAFGPS
jgi:hypothetical protein